MESPEEILKCRDWKRSTGNGSIIYHFDDNPKGKGKEGKKTGKGRMLVEWVAIRDLQVL